MVTTYEQLNEQLGQASPEEGKANFRLLADPDGNLPPKSLQYLQDYITTFYERYGIEPEEPAATATTNNRRWSLFGWGNTGKSITTSTTATVKPGLSRNRSK